MYSVRNNIQKFDTRTSQGLVLTLQDYWTCQGCTTVQPLNIEVDVGTSHPMTCLRVLGSESMTAVYVQPPRRPTDGRYDGDPNCLQHYCQFQAVIKPSPDNIQELRLGSLRELGMDPTIHDTRLVEDNWENPTLGTWGLGWEVWPSGMGVTQFTYFRQVGGLKCKPVIGKITYDLERLVMYTQGASNIYDLVWSDSPLGKAICGDVFYQNEVGRFTYNFECTDMDSLFTCFEQYEKETQQLLALENPLPLPTYERILKVTRSFNLLDARKAISVIECQHYILRAHTLTKTVAETYYASREVPDFPICNKDG